MRNLLEIPSLLRELGSPPEFYFLMPDGLYGPSGRLRIRCRSLVTALFRQFRAGDPLAAPAMDRRAFLGSYFRDRLPSVFSLKPSAPQGRSGYSYIPNVELDGMMARIGAFRNTPKTVPYEYLAELAVILEFLESLKNSKVMQGGIWLSGRSGPDPGETGGYEQFVRNLTGNNVRIGKVKESLRGYPDYSLEEIARFRVDGVRPYLTPYAVSLENLYLHVHLKNTLQRFYLVLAYATEKDKAELNADVDRIKRILKVFEEYYKKAER